MEIMIANDVTGVVIKWSSEMTYRDSMGMRCIRGFIRQWVKQGMSPIDLTILSSTGHAWLDEYLIEYAVDTWLDLDNDLDDLEGDVDIDDFLEATADFDDLEDFDDLLIDC